MTLYAALLKLYPRRHRMVFAEEMLDVFLAAQADAMRTSFAGYAAFYSRELSGLIVGAAQERVRSLSRNVCSISKFGGTMNHYSRCRFPKFAILMMAVVFVILLEIIAKGDGLSHYLFHLYTANGQLVIGAQEHWDLGKSVRHWPSNYRLISGIAVGFLIAWAAGLAAWSVAYLLRKTGAQRLGEFQSWPLNQ